MIDAQQMVVDTEDVVAGNVEAAVNVVKGDLIEILLRFHKHQILH